MGDSRDFTDRSPSYIDRDELIEYCGKEAGFEIFAEMMEVNQTSREIETVPKSRQELLQATGANESTVQRRLQEGVEEFDVLLRTTGEDFEHLDDLVRVYQIKRGRISDEHLREIKKRGWFRPRASDYEIIFTNISGGDAGFDKIPDWATFVDQYLFD